MSQEVLLDLSFLTEEERDLISNVISKDVEIRRSEQTRLSTLREELDRLKEEGLPEDEIEEKNDRYCARCQTYFGILWNKGAFCPRCELKVCKVCRVNVIDEGWICTLCYKVREVKARSGAWFFQGHKEKNGNLFGSMLVRKSMRKLPGSGTAFHNGEGKQMGVITSGAGNTQHVLDDYHRANHAKEEEKHPAQHHRNSYELLRNGHAPVEVLHSDGSDVDSEEQGHDGSVEDNHDLDTLSDRTHSRDIEVPHISPQFEERQPENVSWAENAEKFDDVTETYDTPSVLSAENYEFESQSDVKPGVEAATSSADNYNRSDINVLGDGDNDDDDDDKEKASSFDSRESALRAFSETFVNVNVGQNNVERSEEQRNDEEDIYDEKLKTETKNEEENYQDTRFASNYADDHHDTEDPGSGRSSELHYNPFHADNESMFSETSGYVTPTASEDTSSKRTPSISGDEGGNAARGDDGDRRQSAEAMPVIITTMPSEERQKSGEQENKRNSSITDYDEDLDVSFSKYEMGLGQRSLKDQLSMGSRESIVSYYSNAGGEVFGKYPVSGEILFGIKYDAMTQEFQVQVHQARDITGVDKKTKTSDPYVKTYLLPDRSRGGKRKSRVKKNTVNPVFDEILTYKISYDEILQRTLWLAVWNHDRFGHNDFLGEVLVPIDQYHQSGFSLEDPEPQWYELCERQAGDSQLSYNGEIVVALKYVPPSALINLKKKKKKKKSEEEKGELHVNIIEANNLQAKDANGYSDPFCKSYLLPDKSKKTKQKTGVVKKSLNPKWNYHFVYENVTHEELMDRVLELTVWDFDRGSSNEFLGGVRLGLGTGLQEWDDSTSEEQAAWNKMLNNANEWNEVTVTLRDHMGSHK